MSRWIESGKDENGRWYIETLADAAGCRYWLDEVCCNADNEDMVADFPTKENCEVCPYFERETQEDIERLKDGVKTYE